MPKKILKKHFWKSFPKFNGCSHCKSNKKNARVIYKDVVECKRCGHIYVTDTPPK